MRSPSVLITGAAGLVGSILRSHWGARYSLRLADIRPVVKPAEHETSVLFDMTKPDDCLRICDEIHTVVHLAADPGSDDFTGSLLPRNIIGTYNMFQAAAEAGCRRFIFASSIYAVRGRGPDPPVTPDESVYPQGLYGATKCWGEALARVYSERHCLSCIVIRLGNPRFDQGGDWDAGEPSYMLTPRDTAQLFAHCVDAENVDFGIVHGSSRHHRMWLDIESTRSLLGFDPQDGTAFPRKKP